MKTYNLENHLTSEQTAIRLLDRFGKESQNPLFIRQVKALQCQLKVEIEKQNIRHQRLMQLLSNLSVVK